MVSKANPRKRIRLENYDYSSGGAYFITVCTYQKEKTLGDIFRRGAPCGLPRTKLSELGMIAERTIREIEVKDFVSVDKYVVMPNHVHMIITLSAPPDSRKGCPYRIFSIVGRYKSLVAYKWLCECKSHNKTMGYVWQRSYFDHVIRSEQDYLKIWKYIDENPLKWELDKYYS